MNIAMKGAFAKQLSHKPVVVHTTRANNQVYITKKGSAAASPHSSQPRTKIVARLGMDDSLVRSLDHGSYLLGKSIVLFVFFYCSLNWMHYKRINDDIKKMSDADKKERKDEKKNL
jgi:hypothetical protein